MTKLMNRPLPETGTSADVYCPICTRVVQAQVVFDRKGPRVKSDQKCPRCASALDAGFVLQLDRAA